MPFQPTHAFTTVHALAAEWVDYTVRHDEERLAEAADTSDVYACGHRDVLAATRYEPAEPCDCPGSPYAKATYLLEGDVRTHLRETLGERWKALDPKAVTSELAVALEASRAAWDAILNSGDVHADTDDDQ